MAHRSIFEDARIRALMKSKMKRQEKHVPSVPTEALGEDDVKEVKQMIEDKLQHREVREETREDSRLLIENLSRDIEDLKVKVFWLERAQALVADRLFPQHGKQGDAAPPPEGDSPRYSRTMGEDDDDVKRWNEEPQYRSLGETTDT